MKSKEKREHPVVWAQQIRYQRVTTATALPDPMLIDEADAARIVAIVPVVAHHHSLTTFRADYLPSDGR